MDVFLPVNVQNSSLFLKNSCYSSQCKTKLLFLNAYFLSTVEKYFSLCLINHNQRIVMPYSMFHLLSHSFKTRPEMPMQYHLDTLLIALRLIGGNR